MLEQGTEHVWLDATGLERFDERFPTIAASLREIGLDPARDWLPIAPAAHYLSGGVVTDLDGATALPGLWAAGEVACNGVHGANRLASNSLLDGMVFAPRVVEAVLRGKNGPDATGAMRAVLANSGLRTTVSVGESPEFGGGDAAKQRDELQRAMTADAGVLRSADSLARAEQSARATLTTASDAEVRNLATVALGLLAAATARTESRGCHTRTDHPDTDPALAVRLVLR